MNMMKLADALTLGIAKQFPKEFKTEQEPKNSKK